MNKLYIEDLYEEVIKRALNKATREEADVLLDFVDYGKLIKKWGCKQRVEDDYIQLLLHTDRKVWIGSRDENHPENALFVHLFGSTGHIELNYHDDNNKTKEFSIRFKDEDISQKIRKVYNQFYGS